MVDTRSQLASTGPFVQLINHYRDRTLLMLNSYNSAISEVTVGHDYDIIFEDYRLVEKRVYNQEVGKMENPAWRKLYDTRYVPDHGDIYLAIDRFAFGILWDNVHKKVTFASQGVSLPEHRDTTYMADQVIVSIEQYDDTVMPLWKNFFTIHVTPATDSSPFQTGSISITDEGWTFTSLYGQHISYGASLGIDDGSKIQIALSFMLIVIVCNIGKAAVMFTVLRRFDHGPCVTMGDALASFLERPDASTVGYCIASEKQISESLSRSAGNKVTRSPAPPQAMKWKILRRRFWLDEISRGNGIAIFWLVMYAHRHPQSVRDTDI